MFAFHQFNRVSAIKRMLLYYRHIFILVFFQVYIYVFLVAATYTGVYCVASGSDYNITSSKLK